MNLLIPFLFLDVVFGSMILWAANYMERVGMMNSSMDLASFAIFTGLFISIPITAFLSLFIAACVEGHLATLTCGKHAAR